MAGFDVAAGMFESTFNSTLSKFYNALYPTLLKGSINVGEMDIASVDFDFKASPTVSLQPSDEAKQHIKTAIEKCCPPGTKMSSLHEIASAATFTAMASDIALKINYKNHATPQTTIPSSSLVVHATITVANSNLTVKLLRATVTIPKNKVLTELLNNAFVPYLLDYLNTKILGPIQIPPLGFKSLKISTPLPVIRGSYFTVFSSLGATPSTIPAPLPWPKNGVYAAVDIPALEAASRIIFPLGPQENFSWEIFSGHVGVTVNAPNISGINDDGSISASIEANVSCQLKMEMPWPYPDVTIGPSATAALACTLRPVVENGELKIVPEGIPIPTFSFDWGIPCWINWIFYPLEAGLAAALNAVLGPLVGEAIKIPGIPVYSIPDINIDFGGDAKVKISIDQANPSGLNGSFLVVTAQAAVSKQ